MKKVLLSCLLVLCCLTTACEQKSNHNKIVWYLHGAAFGGQNWLKEGDIAKDGTIKNAYTDKFNALLKEKKMNVEVIFKDMDFNADTSEDESITMQKAMYEFLAKEKDNGNQIDIIPYLNTSMEDMQILDTYLTKGYGKKFKDAMPSTFWKSQLLDNHTYYLPKVCLYARYQGIAVNKEYAKQIGMKIDNMKYDFVSLLPYMRKAKAKGILPFGYTDIDFADYFAGSYIAMPTLSELSTSLYLKETKEGYKIVNLFEEDAYINFLKTVETMNKEKLTGADLSAEQYDAMLAKGPMFYFTRSYPKALSEHANRNQGYAIIPSKKISYIRTGGDAVYKDSKNAEKAVELISLINTDKALSNLFIYGIEGKDYEIKEKIVQPLREDLSLPDSLGSASLLGNYLIAYPSSLSCSKHPQPIETYLKQIPDKSYVGFSPKTSKNWKQIEEIYKNNGVTSAMHASKNLVKKNTALNERLNKAGLQKEIAELQKQLDTYVKR